LVRRAAAAARCIIVLVTVRPSRRAFIGAALPLVACRTTAPPSVEARSVVKTVRAESSVDGAGVHLSRSLGSRALAMLDPFLLLDEIRSQDPREYEKGFPRHPHRGFETVTYMIDGVMEHQDSLGNRGRLTGGSLQWMTAGHGIVHSEMPKQDRGAFWGFQLWVNLPKRLKMTAPRYQDIAPDRVPIASRTRVLAGERGGVRGPVDGIFVAPTMLDTTLGANETFTHELPAAHSAFVYVLEGTALVGSNATAVSARELAVLDRGATFVARAASDATRFLLVAAAPIGEPVARRGPFVMNSEDELDRAFEDYRAGRLTDPA
jgi:redox-sensitive bicupin YhaK (pirin superfamily)